MGQRRASKTQAVISINVVGNWALDRFDFDEKKLYGLLIFFAFLWTVYSCMDFVWGGMCGNQIVEEIQSPNKEFKAIIFTRDCGATSGYSTQLSMVENSDQLEGETGNTFILSDKVGDGVSFDNGVAKIKIIWTSDNSVTVYFDKRTEFTKQKEKIEDIKITYEQLVD